MTERFTVAVDADIADLAQDFLRNRASVPKRAAAAAAAHDLALLQRIGHELKGTAGSYGFRELSTIGATLETAATAGNLASAADAIAQMGDYLARVSVIPR